MHRKSIVLGTLGLLAAFGGVRESSGAGGGTPLVSPNPVDRDRFGNAVAIDGDTAVVTSPFEVFDRGTIHVYARSGAAWAWQQTLPPIGYLYSYSGTAPVAAGGGRIVVGTTVSTGQHLRGSAYVFSWSGAAWVQEQKLNPDGGTLDDEFGAAVAISETGDTILAGAVGLTEAVYVFVRNGTTWTQQQKLTPSGPGGILGFGGSVSVSGDTAVVGARFDGASGAAYVFTRTGTTWTEQQRLTPSDGTNDDSFGTAVGASGDRIVVGAPDHSAPDDGSGAAYVFARSGGVWTQEKRLTGSASGAHDRFGTAVAIRGDTVAAGAPTGSGAAKRAGSVYTFTRSGANWSEQAHLVAAGGPGALGVAVGLSDGRVVAGAPGGEGSSGPGAAFVFDAGGGGGGGTNVAPVFALPPIPTANPAVQGKPVRFGTFAADPDKKDKVTYRWDFGDGTTATSKSGRSPSKKYAAPGSYDVVATAVDRAGATADSERTTVVVVAPGTPFFDVGKLGVVLNFKSAGKDRVQISGQFPLADGTPLEGKVLAFDVGGVAAPFTLDAKGRSGKGATSVRVLPPKGGVAKFTVKLTGSYAAFLEALGLTDATVKNVDATVHVVVTFDGTPYAEDYVVVYAAKEGKTGQAK